jgi:capsular polysaccharide biosynthesis protein
LFGENGVKGFKFWDIVKIGAILMVLFEFMRYSKNNPNTKNALTIGLFVGIIVALGLTTLPELVKRVKTTDFDLESLR